MSMHEISPKGVVTLDDTLLAHLGVEPGAKLEVEFLPNGIISLRAAKPRPSRQRPGGSEREHGR